MVSISHLTLINSVIAIICALYFGTKASEKAAIFFLPLLLSLILGIFVALATLLVFHPICFHLMLCGQTNDMNNYHPFIAVVYFPLFWLAYLIGLAFRPSKPS